LIETIRERNLAEGIYIINEAVKPVAEKWKDGLVRETDNLQITFKSVAKTNLIEVWAYLYYYDSEGKELGHEFDIPEAKISPGTEARVSFMLIPPKGYAYTVIEFKAEQERKENYLLRFALMGFFILVVYVIERFW